LFTSKKRGLHKRLRKKKKKKKKLGLVSTRTKTSSGKKLVFADRKENRKKRRLQMDEEGNVLYVWLHGDFQCREKGGVRLGKSDQRKRKS